MEFIPPSPEYSTLKVLALRQLAILVGLKVYFYPRLPQSILRHFAIGLREEQVQRVYDQINSKRAATRFNQRSLRSATGFSVAVPFGVLT
jgi:hypothetical protein